MNESIEACRMLALVGHQVPSICALITPVSICQHFLDVVGSIVDSCLSGRRVNFTLVETRFTSLQRFAQCHDGVEQPKHLARSCELETIGHPREYGSSVSARPGPADSAARTRCIVICVFIQRLERTVAPRASPRRRELFGRVSATFLINR